ncbi:MAG: hypothetical protein LBL74_00545 [Bacteroidales bacterium]|jgi:hypothetical protein|nr:hypothetical protein [Bacteroidales bacterium]
MKRIGLGIMALCLSFVATAQLDIKWGERFYDIKDGCKSAEIIAEDMSGYYMYYSMEEYAGKGEFAFNYYVVHTDMRGNPDKIVKIDFGNQSYKIEQTWRCGDLVGFILSRKKENKPVEKKTNSRNKKEEPNKTGTIALYTQFFHLKDMRLMDKPVKFKTYNYSVKQKEEPYLFNFSENKTKLAFCFLSSDTTGRKTAEVEVYDDHMRLMWSRNYPLNIENDAYDVKDVAVNNDGNKALIGIISKATGKKSKPTEGKLHLIWLTEYEQRQHNEQIEKAWATDLKCAFNMFGDYMVAGYYGTQSGNPALAIGSFSYLYDDRRGFLKNFSKAEFKDYETDEMIKDGLPLPSQMSSRIDKLIPMVGGNVIMIGEQEFESHIIPARRRNEKPTGEEAMFYRDLIVTNVDKDGFVSGNAYLPKRQKDIDGNNDYNSYAMARDRFGIYIMFNDHIGNYDGNRFEPNRNYNSDKLRTQVNFIQIYNDGSYHWHKAYDTKKNKMPFFKTMFLTTTKKILFFARYGENNVFGQFDLK